MRLRGRITTRRIVLAFVVWSAVVGAGMLRLLIYEYTQGPAADARASWPLTAAVTRDEARPTLVMFVHPQCSCSTASVGELAQLMAHVQGRVDVRLFVYRPSSEAPSWAHSSLWRAAEAIPGVRVAGDDDGGLAGVFGALVSGQTFLYDVDGRLVFSGGITAARGHAGETAARRGIQSWLTERVKMVAAAPVFGCFVRGESS